MQFKNSIVAILLSFIFSKSIGQERFVKAYYTSLKNDTIQGYILDKDWLQNPKVIEFKKDLADVSSQKLDASMISSFKLHEKNEKFLSKRLSLMILKDKISSGESLVLDELSIDYFLRIIIDNSLLKFYSLIPEEDNRQRYYIDKDEKFVELLSYDYLISNDKSTFKKTNSSFIGQLQSSLADCKEFNLGNVSYNESSIKNKLLKYCEVKTGQTYVSKSVKSQKVFSVFGDARLGGATANLIGVGMRVILPRNFGRNYVDVEIKPLAIQNKAILKLPIFELSSGGSIQHNKFKFLYGAGLGGSITPHVWVIPTVGFMWNDKFAIEFRRNYQLGNKERDDMNFNFVRLRYNVFTLK
jgi:hypothetical protein